MHLCRIVGEIILATAVATNALPEIPYGTLLVYHLFKDFITEIVSMHLYDLFSLHKCK